MAATEAGVWGLQDVRDKILASEWSYTGATELWVQGNSGSGKLGLNQGSNNNISSPKQLPGTNWGMGTQCTNTTLNVKSDGTLWAWGANPAGQLGQNNTTVYSSPRQIPGTTWKTVDASANHVLATKTDGSLWAWGEGGGRLGLNQNHPQRPGVSSPMQVGSGTDWEVAIASGVGQSYGVKSDGTFWAWGDNQIGEQGVNDTTSRSSPMQVGTDTTWTGSMNSYSPSINGYYSMGAVKTDGTLWIWGNNEQGMLGLNDQADRSSPTQIGGTWSMIGSSSYASAGLQADGTIWAWGRNQYGNLGQGTSGTPTRKSSPVQIGTATNWVALANGAFNCQGAVNSSGEFWGWGHNQEGQLGNDNTSQQDAPVQIPGIYSQTVRPRIQTIGQLYREL